MPIIETKNLGKMVNKIDECFNINIDSYMEANKLLKGDPNYFIHINNKPINCNPIIEDCNYSNYIVSSSPYVNIKMTTNLDNDKSIRVSLKKSIENDISGSFTLLSQKNNWWISHGDYSIKSSSVMSNIFPKKIIDSIGFSDYSPTPISFGLEIDNIGILNFSVGYDNLHRSFSDFDTNNNTLIDNNPDYSNIKLFESTVIWERSISNDCKLRIGYTYNYFNDKSTQIGRIRKDIVSTTSMSMNYYIDKNITLKLSYLDGQTPDLKLIKNEINPILSNNQLYINNISNINLLGFSTIIKLYDNYLLTGCIGKNNNDNSKYYKLMLSKRLFPKTVLDLEFNHMDVSELPTIENKYITTLNSKMYINY